MKFTFTKRKGGAEKVLAMLKWGHKHFPLIKGGGDAKSFTLS